MKQVSLTNNRITKSMFYRGNNHCFLWESYSTNTICEINVGFPKVTVGGERC
jgi:hypothetical protein